MWFNITKPTKVQDVCQLVNIMFTNTLIRLNQMQLTCTFLPLWKPFIALPVYYKYSPVHEIQAPTRQLWVFYFLIPVWKLSSILRKDANLNRRVGCGPDVPTERGV